MLAAVFTTVWFPAIALFIPLAIQLFPTGRPINRFWSAYLVVSVVGGICLTVSWVLGPDLYGGMGLDGPDTLLPDGPPDWLAAVLAVGTPLAVATIGGALLAPLFRLVRRPGEERLQVLWFVWAALVVLVVNLPERLRHEPSAGAAAHHPADPAGDDGRRPPVPAVRHHAGAEPDVRLPGADR